MEKALIIEDDKDISELISIHLHDMDLEVDKAFDGKEGLMKALNENYRFILLDLRLPKMDGMDVCKKLRMEKNNTPILMLTSKSEESVTLEPNAHVEIEKGKILFKQKKQKEEVIGWKTGMFDFRGTPLKEVIDEIERQFAVTIQLQPKLNDRNATLIFTNKFDVEEVLDFVCKTMQIKFVKQSENVFLVVENS